MFNAFTLLSREWTMSQITHFLVVTFLSWKLGGVKRWTNIMSDFCSLVLSPTHSGSLCHCHSRNVLAPSGAHRLTRSLLGSPRCGRVATVYPAPALKFYSGTINLCRCGCFFAANQNASGRHDSYDCGGLIASSVNDVWKFAQTHEPAASKWVRKLPADKGHGVLVNMTHLWRGMFHFS